MSGMESTVRMQTVGQAGEVVLQPNHDLETKEFNLIELVKLARGVSRPPIFESNDSDPLEQKRQQVVSAIVISWLHNNPDSSVNQTVAYLLYESVFVLTPSLFDSASNKISDDLIWIAQSTMDAHSQNTSQTNRLARILNLPSTINRFIENNPPLASYVERIPSSKR